MFTASVKLILQRNEDAAPESFVENRRSTDVFDDIRHFELSGGPAGRITRIPWEGLLQRDSFAWETSLWRNYDFIFKVIFAIMFWRISRVIASGACSDSSKKLSNTRVPKWFCNTFLKSVFLKRTDASPPTHAATAWVKMILKHDRLLNLRWADAFVRIWDFKVFEASS